MKQYLETLKEIYEHGCDKQPARPGMPTTRELNGLRMVFDLQDGFPVVTTKKMYWKGIVTEQLWFLRGDTNIKYLVDNNVHIWDYDSFKYYNRLFPQHPLSKEEFLSKVGEQSVNPHYKYGDCGRVYGYQFRKWENKFDQIQWVIDNIRKNPDSRYHVVTGWNPSDFLGENNYNASLPCCPIMFQLFTRTENDEDFLDMVLYQRSCDFFLGVPFDISSYSLLLSIIAKMTGYVAGRFTWLGGSCHIYSNHMTQVEEQLKRSPLPLPRLSINCDVSEMRPELWEPSQFELVNYQYKEQIKAPLSVGV